MVITCNPTATSFPNIPHKAFCSSGKTDTFNSPVSFKNESCCDNNDRHWFKVGMMDGFGVCMIFKRFSMIVTTRGSEGGANWIRVASNCIELYVGSITL